MLPHELHHCSGKILKGDLNFQDLLRKMEALLEAAPPTTAYNRTAILALYQTALQPPSLPKEFFQAPAGAPGAAYAAEMQGFQGGNPIIPAPVAGQVSRVLSSQSYDCELSSAVSSQVHAMLRQYGSEPFCCAGASFGGLELYLGTEPSLGHFVPEILAANIRLDLAFALALAAAEGVTASCSTHTHGQRS